MQIGKYIVIAALVYAFWHADAVAVERHQLFNIVEQVKQTTQQKLAEIEAVFS